MLLIDKFENVAVPPDAETLVVPLSVPPAGLFPIAILTVAVELITLSAASRISTLTAGVMRDPATVFDGCTLNAR